jgi:cation:H+ antiporter
MEPHAATADEPDEVRQGMDYGAMAVLVIAIFAMVGFSPWGWDVPLAFLTAEAAVISLVIWQACDPFGEAAQWIGNRFRLPGSVRGATLDAIASSLPELLVSTIFVVMALTSGGDSAQNSQGFGSAIAVVAGSAVYNMILIPAVCALVISVRRPARPTISVSREVITRDGMWFLGCEVFLIYCLLQGAMTWWMALVFMAAYVVYVGFLYRHAKAERGRRPSEGAEVEHDATHAHAFFDLIRIPLNGLSVWLIILAATVVAGVACFFLVDLTEKTAGALGVSPFFVVVILAAAASSIPDTFLSIAAALRGDDSGAVSNAFGSNTFNLCVCLPIPLLISSAANGWGSVSLSGTDGQPIPGLVPLPMLLAVLSTITLGIMWHRHQLTRMKAIALCGLYAIFVGYAVLGSLNLINF